MWKRQIFDYHKFGRVLAQVTNEASLTLNKSCIYSIRGERTWKRALEFPPDYNESHHIFHPPLEEALKHNESPVKMIDIGEKVEFKKTQGPKRRERVEKYATDNSDTIKSITSDDLLGLITEKKSKVLNYDILRRKWYKSFDGRKAIMDLANHYGIYKDLFHCPEHDKVIPEIPKTNFTDFYPRLEFIPEKIIADHFPGALMYKEPEKMPIYYFTPSTYFDAEFIVPGLTDNPDEYEVSTVHRGNIIEPAFCSSKPSIFIDARNGNDSTDEVHMKSVDFEIRLVGDSNSFYTVALCNLDSQLDKPICHWLISNIKNKEGSVVYEEVINYLPVYGINGLGYHRYVFLLLRHENPLKMEKIEDFNLKDRIFDPLKLCQDEENKATPVGLSWFQTVWDDSCKAIFHNVLNMRVPTYEWLQPTPTLTKQVQFPEKAPFNIYLDHYRDPKEINKEVVLERLKSVHPFKYQEQMEPKKVPPNIHAYSHDTPSWMRNIIWKKRNQFGRYRSLRPASAVVPLNNNADLDDMFWPPKRILDMPTRYPCGRKKPIPLRDTKWVLPPSEHPSIAVDKVDRRLQNKQERDEFSKDVSEILGQSGK